MHPAAPARRSLIKKMLCRGKPQRINMDYSPALGKRLCDHGTCLRVCVCLCVCVCLWSLTAPCFISHVNWQQVNSCRVIAHVAGCVLVFVCFSRRKVGLLDTFDGNINSLLLCCANPRELFFSNHTLDFDFLKKKNIYTYIYLDLYFIFPHDSAQTACVTPRLKSRRYLFDFPTNENRELHV